MSLVAARVFVSLVSGVLALTAGMPAVGVPAAASGPSAVPVAAPPRLVAARSSGTTGFGVSYASPVSPMAVLRGFDPPATPYGPGHLGVDLALAAGGTVGSAADGVVSFAGPVAGRGVVVVQHADGIRTEYEPVTPLVHAGEAVARGQPIGRLSGQHAACAPASCVHWSARRGEQYVDPLSLLEPLGPVRLLPWPR